MAKRNSEPFIIRIEVIPHSHQRYDTLGDWFFEAQMSDPLLRDLSIRVSNTGDWRSNMLIAAHELVEAILCEQAGITMQQVDDFDMAYPELAEPGDHPNAPYGQQHCFAMAVERMLAAAMGYPWHEHEQRCKETADEPHPSHEPDNQYGSAVSG